MVPLIVIPEVSIKTTSGADTPSINVTSARRLWYPLRVPWKRYRPAIRSSKRKLPSLATDFSATSEAEAIPLPPSSRWTVTLVPGSGVPASSLTTPEILDVNISRSGSRLLVLTSSMTEELSAPFPVPRSRGPPSSSPRKLIRPKPMATMIRVSIPAFSAEFIDLLLCREARAGTCPHF